MFYVQLIPIYDFLCILFFMQLSFEWLSPDPSQICTIFSKISISRIWNNTPVNWASSHSKPSKRKHFTLNSTTSKYFSCCKLCLFDKRLLISCRFDNTGGFSSNLKHAEVIKYTFFNPPSGLGRMIQFTHAHRFIFRKLWTYSLVHFVASPVLFHFISIFVCFYCRTNFKTDSWALKSSWFTSSLQVPSISNAKGAVCSSSVRS